MNGTATIQDRIEQTRAAGDARALRDALMDAVAAFAAAASACREARDYAGADAVLHDWGALLERARPDLKESQLLYGHSRREATAGYLVETRALEAYFLHGDFVGAPRLLETAEVHHERAAELTARVPVPPEAPVEARTLQGNIAAMQRAEARRVRGMRLLVEGEFESEAGGLGRAVRLLEEAIDTLRSAEEGTPSVPTGADPVAAVLEQGQRALNFVEFARALMHKARSDAALLAGDLAEAAEQQRLRAEALERCRAMHARAGQPLHEGFARRLARDAHVAHQRHDRLKAEAQRVPRWEWLKALAFFGMAVGAAAWFLWLVARFELGQSPGLLALLLFFVMAVAGVGARLVNWREAADWFRAAAPKGKT